MSEKSERGNVIEIVIIVVLLLVILGLVVWRVIDGNKSSQPAQPQSQAEQTIKKEELPKPAAETVDPNKGYIVVADWGVRVKPSTSEKIQYSKGNIGSFETYNFTTATTQSLEGCEDIDNGWIGALLRTKTKLSTTIYLNNGNMIGDYYYAYVHPQSMCAMKSSDTNTVVAQTKIIRNLIETIEEKQ